MAKKHWLKRGLLLLDTDLGYARDYLVPLPDEDLTGTCGVL